MSWKPSEKTCKNCGKTYMGHGLKDQCYRCYGFINKYGVYNPEHFNRKCKICDLEFFKEKFCKYCSPICAKKAIAHQKWIEYRKENNIDLAIPKKFKSPNGSGHREPHGYIYINKVDHPNAQKRGRIYEHTFVMSRHIGRALRENETVHHKNGIRDDNRIENLELWHKGQPAGQRVEDKIKWCKEFLTEYGVKFID
jgi:HNH endonuclease